MIEDKVRELFKEYQDETDNLGTLVNEFFPVALGLRPASFPMCYEFNYKKRLTGEMPNTDIDEEREIAKELGLKLIPYKQISELGIDNLRYFLVKKENRKAITKMKYLQSDQFLYIREIGKTLLDYSDCCVNSFQNCMDKGIIADDFAQKQILEYRESGQDVNPLAYFVWGFIPCKPDCKQAVKKGEAIFKKFMQIDKENTNT
jgi:hypothetical protein